MLQYKRFFDLSVDLLSIVSLDGKFRQVNPAFQRTLGYSEAELLAASFLDFVHPDDWNTGKQEFEALVQGVGSATFETRYRCKDGRYCWLRWMAEAAPEEGLVYAVAHDVDAQKAANAAANVNLDLNRQIEERKAVERALRTSEERLAGILNIAFDAIISIDEAQRITLFNFGAAQMFGYAPEETIGQPLDILLPVHVIEHHAQHIREFAHAPTITRMMHERGIVYARHKNGELFPAEASISKLEMNGETVFTVFMRDISLRVAAQQASERFATIFDATSDIVYITHSSGETIYLNRAGYQMLGSDEILDPAQIDIASLYSSETYEQLRMEALPAALEHGWWSGEGTLQGYQGIRIPVSIVLLAHRDYQGQVAHVAAILRDVSESKRVEDELRTNLERAQELNNLKTRFLSMVSHEFMTPLTIMMTSCELIRHFSDRMPPEKRVAHIEKIEAHIQYLSGMVSNILTISRAESVGLDFRPATLDLNAFLRTLIDEMQLVTDTHRLEFESATPCPPTHADERLLRQVFINLISNAVKYSPEADRVTIQLACLDNKLDVRVRDYGIGIPESDQEHLFSTFFRASNVGSIPGTGLGLAVIQRAVMAHGGLVELESKIGHGTTFTIRLPALHEARKDVAC
jgi:PAS domain S-box-containing protein